MKKLLLALIIGLIGHQNIKTDDLSALQTTITADNIDTLTNSDINVQDELDKYLAGDSTSLFYNKDNGQNGSGKIYLYSLFQDMLGAKILNKSAAYIKLGSDGVIRVYNTDSGTKTYAKVFATESNAENQGWSKVNYTTSTVLATVTGPLLLKISFNDTNTTSGEGSGYEYFKYPSSSNANQDDLTDTIIGGFTGNQGLNETNDYYFQIYVK